MHAYTPRFSTFVHSFLLGFLLLACCGFPLVAQVSERLSDDWEYTQGDIGSTWEAFRPEKRSKLPVWHAVSLPHCFNALDSVDPDVSYYQGPGWYRKYLNVNNPYSNGRTFLHFEGAGQKTEVYLLNQLIGQHVGGYDEFQIDITDAVLAYRKDNPSEKTIPLAIRCDNSRDVEMIPSDLSDFNVYGGLYRHVNLVYQPESWLENPKVDYSINEDLNEVSVKLSAELVAVENASSEFDAQINVIDPTGELVHGFSMGIAPESGLVSLGEFEIQDPELWSPDSPNRYRIEISLTPKKGEGVRIEILTGFKQATFIKKGPFHLNGERYFLRGTHRHEDHAGLAAAMTDELVRQEIEMMKEMGVNFIRLGHYQQSRLVVELCDELGILVWEEIPWCRGGLGGDSYKEQARRMLRNMITQHYNHPSIILWGLGNENDWPGDFSEFDEEKIRGFMSELNDLAHALDPVRKTCIRRCDFCKDVVDVYSPSIWAGWYRGVYTKYQEVSYEEAMKVDHFLHVEWGASHHAGRHSEDPDKGLASIDSEGADERSGDFLMTGGNPRVSKDGDWSETYACNLIDWHLKEQENMDWLTGTAYWPFKDFSTPLRPENPVPYVNQKGVLQRDLRPKESFYVFQSYWTEEPMVHIYGHSWPTRWGDVDEAKLIKVYSNCSEVELFLNGKSVGKRTRDSQNFPAAGLRWAVNLLSGTNHVRAVAIVDGEEFVDEIDFVYQTEKAGPCDRFELEELSREGDVVTISVKGYDENGVFCVNSKTLVEFGITGDAELIDNQGTWDGSRKIQLYNGRAMMKVRMLGEDAYLSVKSKGIPAAFIAL